MNYSNALGLEDFPSSFYQSCWDIIGLDTAFVQDSFKRGWLYLNANCNFVVLILKVERTTTIFQYRLIALAHFLSRIIPKILANRLRPIVTRIISPQQTPLFERKKTYFWLHGLVSEQFNFMDKKYLSGNVGINVDITKAFWYFKLPFFFFMCFFALHFLLLL